MAILRAKDIRKTDGAELDKRLGELRLELAKERGNIHIGGTVTSPGRIREIRKTIARVLTIRSEAGKTNLNTNKTKGKQIKQNTGVALSKEAKVKN